MSESSLPRLFVGFKLPQNINLIITHAQKLLGETPTQKMALTKECLNQIAASSGNIQLCTSCLGTFPENKTPKILWVGFKKETEKLINLANLVENSLIQIGFAHEEKTFTPHATIARIRRCFQPDELNQLIKNTSKLPSFEFTLKEITLFESILAPSGAIYKELENFKLENRAKI